MMNEINFSNFSRTNLVDDKEMVKRIKEASENAKGGSLNYSQQGSENYVRAVQEGKAKEVIRELITK